MKPFHLVCPEIAAREIRSVVGGAGPGLPAGAYAFVEFYCPDQGCDCRRVFIQVVPSERPQTVLASINFGWERESYYRRKMPYDPEAPRRITRGSLDPMNEQSEHAPDLLRLFQNIVADAPYRLRLKRHYSLFRQQVNRRTAESSVSDPATPNA